MLRPWVVRVVPLVLLAGLVSLLFGQGDKPAGKRYALVVGVNDYAEKSQFPPLSHADRDATDLAEELKQAGYTVVCLTSASEERLRPSGKNIRRELAALLARPEGWSKDDLVVLALAGHGMMFEEKGDSYFCPNDANQNNRGSLLAMDDLFTQLGKYHGRCVVLSDACRNIPGQRGVRSGAGAPSRGVLVDGVAALFSCGPAQIARENDKLKHGIFFYRVIEKFRTAREQGEEVSFAGLADYVESRVETDARELAGARQTPVLKGSIGRAVLIPKTTLAKTFTNSIGMAMVLIPSGEFTMGSPREEKGRSENEGPQRTVKITRFYCGKYHVTRGQFAAFVKDTGYKTEAEADGKGGYGWDPDKKEFKQDAKYTWRNPSFAQTDEHPVVLVTWNDAQAFLKWLSEKEKRKYQLPREAEWEYACRAGSKTAYGFGNDPKQLGEYAWFTENSKDAGTDVVGGQRKPNAWGLFDMHGNAWQWCQDRYGSDYYAKGENVDPKGSSNGNGRVLRGGSFYINATYCRAAYRSRFGPARRYCDHGFRVCLRPD